MGAAKKAPKPAQSSTTERAFDPAAVAEDAKSWSVDEKIAWVQHHVGSVDKTGRMAAHNYDYMQEHGLIGVLRPMLRLVRLGVRVGLASDDSFDIRQVGNNIACTVGMKLTATNLDKPGEQVVEYYVNEGHDRADKSVSKALTACTKYALQKFFLVPTEKIDDNDQMSSDELAALATPVAAAVTEITSVQPDPEEVKRIRDIMLDPDVKELFPPTKVKNYLTGEFGVSKLDELNKVQLRAVATWVSETIAGSKPPAEQPQQ